MDLWVPAAPYSVTALCEAILTIFRDDGGRSDRQKARLMYLVDDYGADAFAAKVKAEVASYGRGIRLEAAQPHATTPFARRETLGVHAQADQSLRRVGVHVPAGRLTVPEIKHVADLADRYSAGEVRLTVEQNFILPNVDQQRVKALLKEPALTLGRLSVDPGHVVGPMVSSTGTQFCALAIIETKEVAERVMRKVDTLVVAPKPVRVHWTGCPNSCGQVQAADIGLMGAPAKRKNAEGKMKAVAGCNVWLGGTIGEGGHLSEEPFLKGVPVDDEDELARVPARVEKSTGESGYPENFRERPSSTSAPSSRRSHGDSVASMAWNLHAVEQTRLRDNACWEPGHLISTQVLAGLMKDHFGARRRLLPKGLKLRLPRWRSKRSVEERLDAVELTNVDTKTKETLSR